MASLEPDRLKNVVFSDRTDFDQVQLEILLQQYKLIVDTSERLVARRQLVNTFFLSINTLALSAVGLVAKEANETPLILTGVIAISIAAVMLCVAWKTLVRSYAQLNRGKFAVIDCIEDHLPAALFRGEWVALGEGRDSGLYKPFTKTEVVVSNIFIGIYLTVILVAVGWIICF